MKPEEKRIFISDFPEKATQHEVEDLFGQYGQVKSVEIKERKELGTKNSSLFFAYVTVYLDHENLQKCFKDFDTTKWHGKFVQLQLAKESFLDRLKREREEEGKSNEKPQENVEKSTNFEVKDPIKIEVKREESPTPIKNEVKREQSPTNGILTKKLAIKHESSSSDSSDEENSSKESSKENEDKLEGFVIKSNKGKVLGGNGLKIESFGKEPIVKIDFSKNKIMKNVDKDNLKRLQSLNAMKNSYKSQKIAIQKALSRVDIKPVSTTNKQEKKKSLFNEDEQDDFEANFTVKEKFQNEEGQKLLKLQSRFQNDSRFEMDERFLENEPETNNYEDQSEELTIEEEKRKEYEILGQVLGREVHSKFLDKNDFQRKTMTRFDPSMPSHSQYENAMEKPQKKKRKKEVSEDVFQEKRMEESEKPEVSKEVFYKIDDSLKEKFVENKGFSLLKAFGRDQGNEQGEVEEFNTKTTSKSNGFEQQDKNPFRYDSSESEEEPEETPKKEKAVSNRNTPKFWQESFFFKPDDYRLQEGFDFIERISAENEKQEFPQLRRNLKEIVRAKVRNNQRKTKLFQKKLGGSSNKQRKQRRMKKALKR